MEIDLAKVVQVCLRSNWTNDIGSLNLPTVWPSKWLGPCQTRLGKLESLRLALWRRDWRNASRDWCSRMCYCCTVQRGKVTNSSSPMTLVIPWISSFSKEDNGMPCVTMMTRALSPRFWLDDCISFFASVKRHKITYNTITPAPYFSSLPLTCLPSPFVRSVEPLSDTWSKFAEWWRALEMSSLWRPSLGTLVTSAAMRVSKKSPRAFGLPFKLVPVKSAKRMLPRVLSTCRPEPQSLSSSRKSNSKSWCVFLRKIICEAPWLTGNIW